MEAVGSLHEHLQRKQLLYEKFGPQVEALLAQQPELLKKGVQSSYASIMARYPPPRYHSWLKLGQESASSEAPECLDCALEVGHFGHLGQGYGFWRISKFFTAPSVFAFGHFWLLGSKGILKDPKGVQLKNGVVWSPGGRGLRG